MGISIDIQYAQQITARAGTTSGAPLVITTVDSDNRQHSEIALYTRDYMLTRRIADAINAAVEAHKSEQTEAA